MPRSERFEKKGYTRQVTSEGKNRPTFRKPHHVNKEGRNQAREEFLQSLPVTFSPPLTEPATPYQQHTDNFARQVVESCSRQVLLQAMGDNPPFSHLKELPEITVVIHRAKERVKVLDEFQLKKINIDPDSLFLVFSFQNTTQDSDAYQTVQNFIAESIRRALLTYSKGNDCKYFILHHDEPILVKVLPQRPHRK